MTGDFGRPTRPETALIAEKVKEGIRFVTWNLEDSGSRREGTFLSTVYTSDNPDYNEGLVVDVMWADGHTTTEVASSLGLCHDRYSGKFGSGVCIADDGEGD